jgi:two-component system CheB/CheR fusion protein
VRLPESSRATDSAPEQMDSLNSIFRLLRSATGVDFAHYKPATIRRRVARRMAVHKMEDVDEYARFLPAHAEEAARLYEDLLVSVTSFFRDPAAFLMLKTTALPRLLKNRAESSAIRIWVAGCSSGEEVYSIAICLLEAVAETGKEFDIQIFGTDISDLAIEQARAGIYPVNIREGVSPERLERFFVKGESGYRISKRIRELCVFARQNLISDPPFSRLDLISCRNVLIYLGGPLQRKVLATLHYALSPGGFLLLGESEGLGALEPYFEPQDKRVKLYAKKLTKDPSAKGRAAERFEDSGPVLPGEDSLWTEAGLQKAGDQIVLKRFGPPGVAVNDKMEIVSFRGDTSPYLMAAPGAPGFQLQKMARGTLAPTLRSAIGQARKLGQAVQQSGLRLESGGWSRHFNLEVIPITSAQVSERLWMVLFQETGVSKPKGRKGGTAKGDATARRQSKSQMQADVVSMKDSMQSLLEEYEATNEELQSANEEIQSSNEELQSTNEELQTSKEEIQATNEELVTVNEEMQNRNLELTEANNDLLNLFSNVNTPIVMLGNDLRIRRFTPAAEKVMNLIPGDIGRPISQINLGLVGENLGQEVRKVVETLIPTERVVRDGAERWYMLRIRPYRTGDNRIEGAVVVLVDIDELKRSRDLAQTILDTMRECLVVLDGSDRVKTANLYFYRAFNITAAQSEGRAIYEVHDGMWDVPQVHNLLDGARLHNTRLQNVRVDFERLGERSRSLYLNAQRLPDSEMVLLIAREPTDLL